MKALWYITHFDNVLSIVQYGILCHNAPAALQPTRIDNTDVNKRRTRQIEQGRTLHDYANLYFNPRNGMMFSLVRDRGVAPTDLILIQVSKTLFEREDLLVSDMNAAKDGARIGPWRDNLPRLDTTQIFAKYWNDPDNVTRKLKMARMMAEVLVPNSVPTKYIEGFVVSRSQVARSS